MNETLPRPGRMKARAFAAALTVLFGHGDPVIASERSWQEQIRVPPILHAQPPEDPVVVAIVDDAFDLSDPRLAPFLWRNAREPDVNGRDDDGNGRVDDLHGWDVADNDRNTSPPAGRQADFFHGLRLASIVTSMATTAYGERAPEWIRIMPVKAASDRDTPVYVRQGFAGIAYALDAGADVILTSWSAPQLTLEEDDLLARAERAGVLVIAAAGNIPQSVERYPAAHTGVLSLGLSGMSDRGNAIGSWGQHVDLLAPGSRLRFGAPGPEYDSGSSYAAAMAAGAAALLLATRDGLAAAEARACLLSTAAPHRSVPGAEFTGKLGAGELDLAAALTCPLLFEPEAFPTELNQTRGALLLNKKQRGPKRWTVSMDGELEGIRFRRLQDAGASSPGTVRFGNATRGDVEWLGEYALADLPAEFFVPGTRAIIELEGQRRLETGALLQFEGETIDFATRYCSGQHEITAPGVISDGSDDADYAAATDCKWLITAPLGQRIRIRFETFDTEPRVDTVWLFHGNHTNGDVMARFSGPDLPPEFTTWAHQALLWFVSDGVRQGRGWTARVDFVGGESSGAPEAAPN